MTPDIDNLIGGDAPPPDTPQHEVDKLLKDVASGRGSFVSSGDLRRPVTQAFLKEVFQMDPKTIKSRLLTVKPVGYAGGEKSPRALYDFKEACAYLVEPKIDLDAYIRSIDVNKLPNLLNKVYWEAKRTRLRYLIEAGEAWPTAGVLEVFGRVFMMIKDRVQLWSETMRESVGLTDEQYARFQQMTDDLQSGLHQELMRMPSERATGSMAAESDASEGDA